MLLPVATPDCITNTAKAACAPVSYDHPRRRGLSVTCNAYIVRMRVLAVISGPRLAATTKVPSVWTESVLITAHSATLQSCLDCRVCEL